MKLFLMSCLASIGLSLCVILSLSATDYRESAFMNGYVHSSGNPHNWLLGSRLVTPILTSVPPSSQLLAVHPEPAPASQPFSTLPASSTLPTSSLMNPLTSSVPSTVSETELATSPTEQTRPIFENTSWNEALIQSAKKSANQALHIFVATRILHYLAPSWFPTLGCDKIASSCAAVAALTTLSLRYKKHCMRYFETENACDSTIQLASTFLPGMSGKMLGLTAAAIGYYFYNGPYY